MLVIAMAMLVTSAALGLELARERAIADRDGRLAVTTETQRAALNGYFARAREINLLIAQNPAFRAFDEQPGTHQHKLAAGGQHLHGANSALSYLSTLYPGEIGEACLIDAGGAETARVVNGRPAYIHELSPDESVNPFFAPTLALPAGQVYQAQPYVSPDTGDWVISNSTRLPATGGRSGSIVHFEVTLESFRRRLAETGLLVRIVDADGRVVLDSRHPVDRGARPGGELDRGLAALIGSGGNGLGDAGSNRVAFSRLEAKPGNANRWFVTVAEPAGLGFSWRSIDWDAPVLVVIALGLLVIAIWGFRAHQRELRTAALSDPLTGLPNRVLFFDRAAQAVAAAKRDGLRTGVLLVDLDRFKQVNDTLGHVAGDAALVEIARRLTAAVRQADTVARLGGDEFAVLLPCMDGEDAVMRATRNIQSQMEAEITVDGVTFVVGASVGVAIAPEHGEDPDQLVMAADRAMYEAKRTGARLCVGRSDPLALASEAPTVGTTA